MGVIVFVCIAGEFCMQLPLYGYELIKNKKINLGEWKMKVFARTAALFGLLTVMSAGPALALEVTRNVTIDKPVEVVWEKIGGWCAIAEWHPAIVKCNEQRDDENLRRLLTLDGGGEIIERLIGENEVSYSYAIEKSPLPFKNYEATISVEPDEKDDEKTLVIWTSSFDADGKPDKEVEDIVAGIYEGGLSNIAKMMAEE